MYEEAPSFRAAPRDDVAGDICDGPTVGMPLLLRGSLWSRAGGKLIIGPASASGENAGSGPRSNWPSLRRRPEASNPSVDPMP